jgi:sulfatase maturation enzyme AslB (radical SAM superfamily)
MKINTINSIEVSSICDNKCKYCPAPVQGEHRETGYMTMEVFEQSLDWVRHFIKAGTQRELNLFGVGEPTLNELLPEMVEKARLALPMRIPVHLNTNGNTMTTQLAMRLRNAGITHIDITDHKARSTAQCIRIFKSVGITGQLSRDFVTMPNNWAGQVDWFAPDYTLTCNWLGYGQVMVMSNGDVTTCCIDAFGKNIVGNVSEDITQFDLERSELCETCHHEIPAQEPLIEVVGR